MKSGRSKKTKDAYNSREFMIAVKSAEVYCTICSKRAGRWDAYCGPRSSTSWRRDRNWKSYRKTQYR